MTDGRACKEMRGYEKARADLDKLGCQSQRRKYDEENDTNGGGKERLQREKNSERESTF